ncbi:MAG: hypothetical protein NZ874_01550 [Fimbriimonadales bacterium]|nr:hypothetical protein [Fimbriimonadales bacterium]
MSGWFDGLIFWGVMYRRLSVAALLRGSWWFAVGAGVVGLLLLPLLVRVREGAGVHLLLGWLALMHLLARGWVERRLPDPSFAHDLRTGNFEQLRLMPYTAHALLLQRGIPDLLFRALAMCLWLPLHGVVAQVLGLGFLDCLTLWLLFSFANYFVLGLVSLALFASAWEGTIWALVAGLLAYAFLLDGGRTRTAVSSSGLFSAMIALPVAGRVLLPTHMLFVLPDLRGFTMLWLLVEALRFERMARWVNAPSSIGRGLYVVPSAGLMALAGALAWQLSGLQGYSGAEQTQLTMLGIFATAGYLSLLLLTVRRQAEPVAQPLRAHLLEVGLLRVLSGLLVMGALLAWGLPTGSGGFWSALVWLSIMEVIGSALVRRGVQFVHSRAANWAYGALLLGLLPTLMAWFALLPPMLSALSPTYALLMASDAWRAAGIAAQPPLWVCLSAPLARYALVLGVLALAMFARRAPVSWVRRRAPLSPTSTARPAIEWYGLLWLYPLWDWLVQRYAQNPMTRLTIGERQPAWAMGIGCGTFAVGALLPNPAQIWSSIVLIIGLGIFLWLWGYHTTARRVRRWLDSGELASAFLAGLQPSQIFWGWVYGAWSCQLRILIAAVSGYIIGRGVHLLVQPPALVGGIMMIGATVAFGLYALYLALWSCAWLVAAPSAVRDQLALPQSAAPLLSPRAALLATFYTLLACCAPLAPFLLVGLPIYVSQSTIALNTLARAPGELKRRYGIS